MFIYTEDQIFLTMYMANYHFMVGSPTFLEEYTIHWWSHWLATPCEMRLLQEIFSLFQIFFV